MIKKRVDKLSKQNDKGKLTVFLGAVPGVGKTCAMLEAASKKASQGANVCIGCLDNANRPEYDAFLILLPSFRPRQKASEIGAEIDIDTIVQKKPDLVVIDDMAGRCIQGRRHNYRYQYVEELLQRGIDVYTTINIYQVESQIDIVERITGIKISEAVSDRLLETAEIILIDLSYEELLQRIKNGKVSWPLGTVQNTEIFFSVGNIGALREMALRYAAQRIGTQLNEYMLANDIKSHWPARERILACVSPSPFSAHVIRAASRIAAGLKADWCAAYVETRQRSPGDNKGYKQLDKNLRLADELGAEVITLYGEDIVRELLNLAERKNITQIVIGKTHSKRFLELWKGSVVDNIVKNSREIGVHIIPGKNPGGEKRVKTKPDSPQTSFYPYILSLLLVAVITFLNMLIGFDLINIALLYLLPVLFSAAYWGRGPSVFASVLGVLSFDFFFVPPMNSMTFNDLKYSLSFAVFLLVAVTTGTMATRLRSQAETARRREARTAALYSLSKKMVVETELQGIFMTVVTAIAETIDAKAIILMPEESGKLAVQKSAGSAGSKFSFEFDETIAQWVFEQGKIAGNSTETWGDKESLYIPLKTEEKSIGVLGVKPNQLKHRFSTDQRQLLEAVSNLTALAVYSQQLSQEAEQARYIAQSEKLRTALFNSLSHELRTPLASIMGAVTSILDAAELYKPSEIRDLLQTVNDGALRMNRLVGNLLDMARLESGMMQLKNEWCEIQEIIGVVLRRMQTTLKGQNISIEIAPDISMIRVDFALIEQVLVNLLDNAHKYSFPGSEIIIWVKETKNEVIVYIENSGVPIPEEDKHKIFEKFYRLSSSHDTSTGLGLSICKGIIEAHGGRIWIETGKETNKVVFSLPKEEITPRILTGGK